MTLPQPSTQVNQTEMADRVAGIAEVAIINCSKAIESLNVQVLANCDSLATNDLIVTEQLTVFKALLEKMVKGPIRIQTQQLIDIRKNVRDMQRMAKSISGKAEESQLPESSKGS